MASKKKRGGGTRGSRGGSKPKKIKFIRDELGRFAAVKPPSPKRSPRRAPPPPPPPTTTRKRAPKATPSPPLPPPPPAPPPPREVPPFPPFVDDYGIPEFDELPDMEYFAIEGEDDTGKTPGK